MPKMLSLGSGGTGIQQLYLSLKRKKEKKAYVSNSIALKLLEFLKGILFIWKMPLELVIYKT